MTITRPAALERPPPENQKCYLRRDDGSEIIGWRIFDRVLGRSRYWAWSTDARRPSLFTSAWQKAGLLEVFPIAWRPLNKVKVAAPLDPIARREAEIMLHRAILTDGTVRKKTDASAIESSWDDSWHNEETALIDQIGLEVFARFVPEPFDGDNYLIGMGWFARLKKPGDRGKDGLQYNREQRIAIWKAYGYSFEWMGEKRRLNVSRQRVSTIYKGVIDRVWQLALADQAEVRRIPRALWQTSE